jgi:serine/threonine-protein kinase
VVDRSPSTDRTNGIARGHLIGRKFIVEHMIGGGGVGVVYAARHKDVGTQVAIKIGRLADRESSMRFQREARIMMRLENEHTARVLDVGETNDGLPWMVMEYLDGIDLGAMLAEVGPLPLDDVLRWMLQVCDSLAEAHDEGIFHRNLGPQNLFLARPTVGTGGSPSIRVLDYGLGLPCTGLLKRLEAGELRSLRPGEYPGTSYFMAPEQIRGMRLDARTDIWAAGACLFRLLTNHHAFGNLTLAQLWRSVLGDPTVNMRRYRPDVPTSAETLLRRCLQRDPRERFQSIRDMQSALRDACQELRNTPIVMPTVARKGARDSEKPPVTPVVPVRGSGLHDLRAKPVGRMASIPEEDERTSEGQTVVGKSDRDTLTDAVEMIDSAPTAVTRDFVRRSPMPTEVTLAREEVPARRRELTATLERDRPPVTSFARASPVLDMRARILDAPPDTTVTLVRPEDSNVAPLPAFPMRHGPRSDYADLPEPATMTLDVPEPISGFAGMALTLGRHQAPAPAPLPTPALPPMPMPAFSPVHASMSPVSTLPAAMMPPVRPSAAPPRSPSGAPPRGSTAPPRAAAVQARGSVAPPRASGPPPAASVAPATVPSAGREESSEHISLQELVQSVPVRFPGGEGAKGPSPPKVASERPKAAPQAAASRPLRVAATSAPAKVAAPRSEPLPSLEIIEASATGKTAEKPSRPSLLPIAPVSTKRGRISALYESKVPPQHRKTLAIGLGVLVLLMGSAGLLTNVSVRARFAKTPSSAASSVQAPTAPAATVSSLPATSAGVVASADLSAPASATVVASAPAVAPASAAPPASAAASSAAAAPPPPPAPRASASTSASAPASASAPPPPPAPTPAETATARPSRPPPRPRPRAPAPPPADNQDSTPWATARGGSSTSSSDKPSGGSILDKRK